MTRIPCETCGGTGIAGVYSHIDKRTGEHQGDEPIRCDVCGGSGEVYPSEMVALVVKALADARPARRGIYAEVIAVLDAIDLWAKGGK